LGGGGGRKKSFVSNYFTQLFRSSQVAGAGQLQHLLDAVQPSVTAAMNEHFLKEFTCEEIKQALNSIGDLKVPGPDGMPAIFYKNFWDVVGDQVTKEVMGVLKGDRIPIGWNDTVIALIPKVEKPEKVTHLRPISLCNLIYKVVSKVLS
jgi:hypothetical protein